MGKLYDELKKRNSIKDSSDNGNPPVSERILKTLYGWVCIEPDSSFADGFNRKEILSCIDGLIGHIRFLHKAQVGDEIIKTEGGFFNRSQLNRVAKPSKLTTEDTAKDKNK